MFHVDTYRGTKKENYQLATKQLQALMEGEPNKIANLSNASALLNQLLDRINWVGFYLEEGNELVLGPFQGLPACVRIPFGKGVCGTAWKENKVLRIANVNEFPGHIACDTASQSEIVVPLVKNGSVFGVLDIDSPEQNRFDEEDEAGLTAFAAVLAENL
ncbi:GAF domain-containing protein [Heyndrickxia acidiproducens]|uniref:GAF domain-containing protein n=1 Tax=Heyndrickxia acidiproducens TaxID=1121084 RepID=UPI0003649BAE|nr:GAF domain-containing protein [Heyndrickxia acidiproducens]